MAERPQNDDDGPAALIAQLSDLRQLDREAVEIYATVSGRLTSERLRRTTRHFREDHERHIDELTRLMRAHGWRPSRELRVPLSGDAGAALAASAGSGDRAILRLLKGAERRGRDGYRVAAQRTYPAEVAAVLRRAANDESAHYTWALEMLDDLDTGRGRVTRSVSGAIDDGGARLAGLVEDVGRQTTAALGRARAHVAAQLGEHPVRSALVAVGVGLCAATLGGARNGRRGTPRPSGARVRRGGGLVAGHRAVALPAEGEGEGEE